MGMARLSLAQEATQDGAFDAVRTEVLWRRLIGVVDEASAALVRSAFSTVVRESDDFSVRDHRCRRHAAGAGPQVDPELHRQPAAHGRSTSAPSSRRRHRRRRHPDHQRSWLGTGHLPDITLAMPVFHDGRLVAFAASTAHAPDIGGAAARSPSPTCYEEGFQIPPLKLARRGELDRAIMALLAKNVRAPEEVLGDLHGQMAALHLVRRRVATLLADWRLPNLDAFAEASCARTDRAVRDALARLPHGSWEAEEETDGMDGVPIRLKARVTLAPDGVTVDYAGSSGQIPAALNVAWCYTFAFTAYALKCVLDPESPNNAGSQRAIRVIAPEGSILNHAWPFSGGNRALVGHYLPALVLRALAQAVPEKVIAATGSPIWSFLLRGQRADGTRFALKTFFNGGMGAGAHGDGESALSWPSNVSSTPVEVIEQHAPIRVLHRRIRRGSGGAGAHRGGDGLEQDHLLLEGGPYSIGFNAERTRAPARGVLGGQQGACGAVRINGTEVDIKNSPFALRSGDVVGIATPGGGGYGEVA